MVGEIRDAETAQIAIQSALTGHLVFTTVHANNVVDVTRPVPEHGRRGIQLCFCVELHSGAATRAFDLRILPHRGAPTTPPHSRIQRSRSGAGMEGRSLSMKAWDASSAPAPDFRGRTAIHELLELSDRIREMILAKKPTSEIRRAAREEGMRFLRESALDKVRLGMTTLKEINKVTFIEAMR
jgi:type IV pilus assembly protein PilB